jgi:hypothetical protein
LVVLLTFSLPGKEENAVRGVLRGIVSNASRGRLRLTSSALPGHHLDRSHHEGRRPAAVAVRGELA